MRLRFVLFLVFLSALTFGQAHPAASAPLPISSQSLQDDRVRQLARTLESRGLMTTPTQISAWESRAAGTSGPGRLEQLRRISIEALTASDMARAHRWMNLYAAEIRLRKDDRHARALQPPAGPVPAVQSQGRFPHRAARLRHAGRLRRRWPARLPRPSLKPRARPARIG